MSAKDLHISSTAFESHGTIPERYTCDGDNISPALRIDGIPESAQSLVIIVDDPDAPDGTFTHWIAWDIPPQPTIEENNLPGGVEGMNSFGKHRYMGPCPPHSEKHHYHFKVFALDSKLGLPPNSTSEALEMIIKGKAIAYGELVGSYKRA